MVLFGFKGVVVNNYTDFILETRQIRQKKQRIRFECNIGIKDNTLHLNIIITVDYTGWKNVR